ACGYGASAIDLSGGLPSYIACQISSVINGITGCRRRREASKSARRLVHATPATSRSAATLALSLLISSSNSFSGHATLGLCCSRSLQNCSILLRKSAILLGPSSLITSAKLLLNSAIILFGYFLVIHRACSLCSSCFRLFAF